MKTIIFSLGFDISGIISALTTMPLETGDKLVFIIPSRDTERSIRARQEIENFLNILAIRGMKLNHTYLRVNEEDIQEMLRDIMKVILDSEGEVYIEATGGLRSIIVALTLAAVILRKKIAAFHTIAESSGKRISISLIDPNPLDLDKIDVEILKLAASLKGEITTPYVEVMLNLTKPTATRRLHKLLEKGLLVSIARKPAKYKLTPLGWLVTDIGRVSNADTSNKG